MKVYEILTEAKQQEPAKPRNFVAKNARATTSGAGAHKDKKKAAKQGYEKHKKQGVTENIQSVDDWKTAVLQAYPQYADKIKFKGRGLQINAEIPGLDRSFGVYDLGSETGEVLHETATAGSTSAGNVGVGAVYKNKPAKQAKNKDGTAKNALDMKANLLTGGSIKR